MDRIIIANGMLGREARWLRILGLQVIYKPDLGDEELLELAGKNNGVLLTRDKALANKAKNKNINVIVVPQQPIYRTLAFLSKNLNFPLEIDFNKTRCPLCGEKLERIKEDTIKDKLPYKVAKCSKIFFKCKGCGHIYWVGSHIREMNKILNKSRAIIYGKTIT